MKSFCSKPNIQCPSSPQKTNKNKTKNPREMKNVLCDSTGFRKKTDYSHNATVCCSHETQTLLHSNRTAFFSLNSVAFSWCQKSFPTLSASLEPAFVKREDALHQRLDNMTLVMQNSISFSLCKVQPLSRYVGQLVVGRHWEYV